MEKFITDQIQEEAINDLSKLVGIASFNEPKESKAPFGKGPKKALDEALSLVEKLGFKTFEDPNGYYGYADIGEGDQTFGIVGHLDEVPAGNLEAWDVEPYKLTQKDDKLYGRGTQDDKGPTIAAIYAIKAILDKGYKFNKKIRVIFGTDEEILWRCLAEYNKKEDPIDMGIAPDAEFPLIYAEKGLQQSYLTGPGSNELNIDLENAFNAVPGKAIYDGPKQAEVYAALQNHNFEAEHQDGQIEVAGKSVHAMNAPQGVNAVVRLGIALSDVYPDIKVLQFLKAFGEDANATNLLGDVSDDVSGKLTFNISSLKITKDESRMQIDMRIPVKVDHDELIQKVSDSVAKFDLKYEDFDYVAPLYVPTDSELVKTLMKTYQDLTGDTKSQPAISGGATFARTMHNCVAFGAMLPTTPDFMHQANENWSKADMKKAMEIFAEAIYRLCV
ncbi:M20 family metallopeptidase [Companilactobacillus halodurans]|uniref:Sapep family Mn(2+)-dependent dipeptidase n=1 Tax=Companilactobacillus halodurans TaxID=2584183 RepID=A0A5P0ZZG1_9LACO|nr:M20 family metallopeptidase [Companilactobacillus halodurans]MQS74889.1 Sapep family Mn(2+)-dependent dipeptidase [Companilactobacillus halodurans]MQS98275.1 Sapep family Mn(2+)-dependent dipeptidase [Companilactobacillus halodurans]